MGSAENIVSQREFHGWKACFLSHSGQRVPVRFWRERVAQMFASVRADQ